MIGFIGLLMALLIGLVKMHECGPCFSPCTVQTVMLLCFPLPSCRLYFCFPCCVCQLHVLHVFQANECFSLILMPCDRAEFLYCAVLEFFDVKTVLSESVRYDSFNEFTTPLLFVGIKLTMNRRIIQIIS